VSGAIPLRLRIRYAVHVGVGTRPFGAGLSGWSHISATPQVIGSWDGAAHDFKVYHKDNRYRFYIGNTEHASIPESDICWTPTRAWWFSETWDNGDALGGSVGNKLFTSSTNYAQLGERRLLLDSDDGSVSLG
jgi:hypothetical protein